jgi:acyl-CoA synthetase (AMP-forming)/AMP-acid ligase II
VGERELLDYCRSRLTAYTVPRLVEFRAELPITTTGKLLRRLLKSNGTPQPGS